MKLPHTLLIACLSAASLCAQQVEPKTETPKPAAPGDATGGANGVAKIDKETGGRRHSRGEGHGTPQPEQKAVAYVGLLTREVPVELRTQFSLAEGFGLLVDEVMPDSPAETAGLKKHDVLVKFEDQQLVNMEQFMALVRAKKKGDVVQLDVITGGKETKVSVTLGERMVAASHGHDRDHDQRPHHGAYTGRTEPNSLPHGQMFLNGDPRLQDQGNAAREQMERFQKEMREYQQRIQEWSRGGGNGPMPQPPQLNLQGNGQQHHDGGRRPNGPQAQNGLTLPIQPGANVQQFNFTQSAANVTRRDDSGEYTIKTEDGKKTFIARPNNGQEKSWPINNDAERQAVPEALRDKLRMMDGASSGIRIEINPGPGNVPSNPENLPPVKGKATSA